MSRARSTVRGAAPLVVALAIGSAAAAAEQDPAVATVAPGDGGIDGRRIPASTNAWRSYRVDADGERQPLAIWYDTISVVTREGRELLRRVQWIVRDDGAATILVNEADRTTLLPLRALARPATGEPFIDLRFDGNRVTGRRPLQPHNAAPADAIPVDLSIELPAAVYDWRWWGVLVAALPLAPDYAARFLAFATEGGIESPLVWITARVVGQDTVAGVAAWVVDVDAGTPWRIWIARDRGRHPVQRIRIRQPDGSALLWEPEPRPGSAGTGPGQERNRARNARGEPARDTGVFGPAPLATLFAPGVISTVENDDLHLTFAPGGRRVYFVRRVPGGQFTIHASDRTPDGGWTPPAVAPFSGRFADQEPFVSGDGRRLYFTSNRPLAGAEPVRGRNAWMAVATDSGWGQPVRLEAPLRIEPPGGGDAGAFWGQARGPVEGPDRALYFWAERPRSLGNTDLYRAPAVNGRFGEPENVGPPINSPGFETGAALAPNGRYLVFGRDADLDGHGLGDLYVSFREGDGWAAPRNLGPLVNSDQFDFAPRFSPDGRYLFFSSNRNPDGPGRGRQNIYFIELDALGLPRPLP